MVFSRCEWHSSTTRFRQSVTVGGWTWANNEGNVGKLSEAMKIAKGNFGNLGESFLVDSGKLKTRFATDLALQHCVETQSRRPGKDFGTVGGHAPRLFDLRELADPIQNWKKLPKNPER